MSFPLSCHQRASSASSLAALIACFQSVVFLCTHFWIFLNFNFFINISFYSLSHEYRNSSFHCLVQLTGCCGTSGNPEKSTKIVRICCYLLLSFRRIAEALNQIAKLGCCSSAVLPGCFQHSLSSWLFQTPPKHCQLLPSLNFSSSFVVLTSRMLSLLHTSDKKLLRKLFLLAGLGSLCSRRVTFLCSRVLPQLQLFWLCAVQCVLVYILLESGGGSGTKILLFRPILFTVDS